MAKAAKLSPPPGVKTETAQSKKLWVKSPKRNGKKYIASMVEVARLPN